MNYLYGLFKAWSNLLTISFAVEQHEEHVFERCQRCPCLDLVNKDKLLLFRTIAEVDVQSGAIFLQNRIGLILSRKHQIGSLDRPERLKVAVEHHEITAT